MHPAASALAERCYFASLQFNFDCYICLHTLHLMHALLLLYGHHGTCLLDTARSRRHACFRCIVQACLLQQQRPHSQRLICSNSIGDAELLTSYSNSGFQRVNGGSAAQVANGTTVPGMPPPPSASIIVPRTTATTTTGAPATTSTPSGAARPANGVYISPRPVLSIPHVDMSGEAKAFSNASRLNDQASLSRLRLFAGNDMLTTVIYLCAVTAVDVVVKIQPCS